MPAAKGTDRMAQPFIGEIIVFGGNFAPLGYMQCAGQSVQISSNDALYYLIGTTYGGDGVTTFNMPDLRGRVAIGAGQGPGLANYVMGQAAGTETVTLTSQTMPLHNHALMASASPGAVPAPSSSTYLATQVNANTTSTAYLYAPYNANTAVKLAVQSVSNAGGGQPHNNVQPVQAINYCISMYGVFPSQS